MKELEQPPFSLEAGLFNALAHPCRLEILELLREGERCVCHIQAMLEMRQAYISQQLNVLRNAGLVTSRKEGLRVYYTASDPGIYDLVERSKALLNDQGRRTTGETAKTLSLAAHKPCTCPHCAPVTREG